ncbi:LysR family transcriptional regulator [Mesorhizobium sp. CC13]|uniref:LysR family transcriptional regulator n=1 Tax=Mesorhizobium sp. CC13 TaxID=3029194 RepID=UPI003265FCD1
MFDWNDLRYLIATARHGSTLKAAGALGVNQTTVARRIKVLEDALGIELFHRRQTGYVATEEGRAVLDLARATEEAVARLEEKVAARKRALSGKIRITGTELAARLLLAPAMSRLRTAFPEIATEIISTDDRLDLGKGEADIALRAGGAGERDDIVRRRLPDSVWAIYMARSLAETLGMPENDAAIARFPVIAGEGAIAAAGPVALLEKRADPARIALRSNSLPGLLAAAEAGLGLAALPAIAAHGSTLLVRCDALGSFPSPFWLCWHESRRNDPLIRGVADFLATEIAGKKALITGQITGM